MRTSYVADWMSTPPILVEPSTSLAEAHQIMEHRHVRRLPVVERGRLIAIISRGDLRAAQPSIATMLSAYERHTLLERVSVATCMTGDLVTIGPGATVLEAGRLMLQHKIGGLPVVVDARVVGVITESDLFRLLIAEATGTELAEDRRTVLVCWHCGALLRQRSFAMLGPNDMCWQCHYHLHRCENCRNFDGITCMLDRADRHTSVPGQYCEAFALLSERAMIGKISPV